MGDFHRNLETVELHAPGYIATTDPETTHGTGAVSGNFGVKAGQLWIEESSEDTPTALKYRNAANDGWVSLISDPLPSTTAGDLLYADGADSLTTLGIGTARQVLQTNTGATAPEWTSNLDLPGTLDVTGAATLDSTLDVTGAVTLTVNLGVTEGGTGLGTVTAGDLLYADGSDSLAALGIGSEHDVLVASATPLPAWKSGLTNDNIAAAAEIAVSKLADGTARQLIQTDAAGTGVEWASNIDIPGTLDVTGAVTLDSNTGIGAAPGGTTRLLVKGATSDTSANAFVMRNSSAVALFSIRNDGRVDAKALNATTVGSTGAATLDTGANGSSFGGELTLNGGVLALAETTTPGATAGEGRIYTKTDNKLYFQDGSGTEHELATV